MSSTRRWELQSWDAPNGRWRIEAAWADGNAQNGTARKDQAFREAIELASSGVAARVIDRNGCFPDSVVARFDAGFLTKEREHFRGVLVTILQTACDADEADPKALLHEIAELCARELPETANGEVRGASQLSGEASSAEGAPSTTVLGHKETNDGN